MIAPDFRAAYTGAFAAFVADPSESARQAAYELGRTAVVRELSLLDVAIVHHDALLTRLARASGDNEVEQTTRAAAEFFVESLSAYEMVQRGFTEAHNSLMLERGQARLVRGLSSFLADTSLAGGTWPSLQELLTLVAEQARELVGAACCVALMDGSAPKLTAASYVEEDDAWERFLNHVDLEAMQILAGATDAPARLSYADLSDHAELLAFANGAGVRPPLHGWLVAPLVTLDGRRLGSLQLFDKQEGEFSDVDEAVAVHLAEMVSAALERARLYAR